MRAKRTLFGYEKDRIFQKAIKCSVCGNKFWNYGYKNNKKLAVIARQQSLCLQCAQWMNLIINRPEDMEIIEGVAYHFKPMAKKRSCVTLGSDGEHKYIVQTNGAAKESNDIWLIGRVPESFKDQLPDTAWWIAPKYGKRLLKYPFKCHGKFCLDRYRCLRYCIQDEYETGPENTIPHSWHIGDERCKYFVDILSIQNYYNFFNPQDVIFNEKKN